MYIKHIHSIKYCSNVFKKNSIIKNLAKYLYVKSMLSNFEFIFKYKIKVFTFKNLL